MPLFSRVQLSLVRGAVVRTNPDQIKTQPIPRETLAEMAEKWRAELRKKEQSRE